MTQPTLINFHPNEYGQSLRFFPFAVNLYSCMVSCNTLNDLFDILCVPGKKEDLKLNVFEMVTGVNDSKILTKHTYLCKFECKFGSSKCKSTLGFISDHITSYNHYYLLSLFKIYVKTKKDVAVLTIAKNEE